MNKSKAITPRENATNQSLVPIEDVLTQFRVGAMAGRSARRKGTSNDGGAADVSGV
jgi:hypothetical protein